MRQVIITVGFAVLVIWDAIYNDGELLQRVVLHLRWLGSFLGV